MYHLVVDYAALPSVNYLRLHSLRFISSHDKGIIMRCAKIALQGQHCDNYAFILEETDGVVSVTHLGRIKNLGERK